MTGPICEEEGKTPRHLEFPLPADLNPFLQLYLGDHWQVLARQSAVADSGLWTKGAQHLWFSPKGEPMSEAAIYNMVVRRMTKRFGRRQTPHMFRDAAATWIAIESPDQVRITCSILGHAQLRTSERHYNHAHMMEATRRYQKTVLARRQPVNT